MGQHRQMSLIVTDEDVQIGPGDGRSSYPALTVRQPHAWGLIYGSKRIENRSWTTDYRGPVVIHAGSSRADLGACREYPGLADPATLRFGVIYGVVDMYDVVPLAAVRGGPYAQGPWCWLTRDPRPCVPRRWRGEQGLFEVPAHAVLFTR